MKHDNNEPNTAAIDLGLLLRDLTGMLRRLWWLGLALAVLLSGLLSLRARLGYHPMYQASSTFTVYVTSPLQSEIRGYNTATAEQMAKTFPYILTSGALKDMVVRDLGIPAMPGVSASVMPNTNIFTLTVTDSDPQRAWDVLESVIAHYPEVAEFVVGPTVMKLLDESGVPSVPYNQVNYGSTVKKGAVLGLGLWVVLALVLAMARSTVHNEEELNRVINTRCIGALPAVKRGKREKEMLCPMLGENRGSMSFSEAVRLMRVRVQKLLEGREVRVLLISSATPGEGKTTVAVNLAKSMAVKGKRVLLIDCDLRNPSVAKNLEEEQQQKGLAEYLSGSLKAGELVRTTKVKDLSAIYAGAPVDNAAELLARREMALLLGECRKQFDCIILDTPPSSLLADAAEIAGLADGALLVIRQDYAPRAQIVDGARLLTDSGLPLLGCVMNYAMHRSGPTGGGYGYGYGYGGYGRYGHYGSGE